MPNPNVPIIETVQNKKIGSYYALRNPDAKKPFTNPMGSCQCVELLPSDIVVDIGAYIGEYSMWASKFVQKVYSYEASPATFEVLTKNKKPNMTIFNKAVVGDDRKTVTLFLSKGIGATNSVVKHKGKIDSVNVQAINYTDAVKGATVVKIDVEGAEYTYDIIQPHLRAIILEFHPITGRDWKAKAHEIMGELNKSGFKPKMVPEFKNGWDTNSAWVRN